MVLRIDALFGECPTRGYGIVLDVATSPAGRHAQLFFGLGHFFAYYFYA